MNPFDELYAASHRDGLFLLGVVLGFSLFWVGAYFWG